MYLFEDWKHVEKINARSHARAVTLRMPARFDFIGGWTDTPPYYFENDAAVLNASLTQGCQSNELLKSGFIEISVRPGTCFKFTLNNVIIDNPHRDKILSVVQNYLGLEAPSVSLSVANHIPEGSGLGGSSLYTASLLTALTAYYHGSENNQQTINYLINNVLYLEQLVGSGGGWQDQIGGIMPGVKLIESSPGDKFHYRISYTDKHIEELCERCILVNTYICRMAINILAEIRSHVVQGSRRALNVLRLIRENAIGGFRLLENGHIDEFAMLMTESWQKVNEIVKSDIEICGEIRRICGDDISGFKLGGAGNGGFLLLILKDGERKKYYLRKMRTIFDSLTFIDPVFGLKGMQIATLKARGSSRVETFETGRFQYI